MSKDTNSINFNFYKELYFAELNRRDSFNTSTSIPFTVLSALWGYCIYLINYISLLAEFSVTNVSIFLLALTSLFLIRATFCFCAAIHGHDYMMVPTADKIEDLLNNNPKHDQQKLIKSLQGNFTTSASHNSQVNDDKFKLLHNCREALIFTLIIGFVATFYNFTYNLSDSIQINYTNMKVEFIMQNDKDNESENSEQESTPKLDNRLVKEENSPSKNDRDND